MTEEARKRKPLAGMTIGIVAFNARPIACSVTRLGARVVVSDYWGDADLAACCDSYVSLLNPQPGQRQRGSGLDVQIAAGLVDNLLDNYKAEKIDAVMVGSGLDDSPEQVKRLRGVYEVIGNDETRFIDARNPERVRASALLHGLSIPANGHFVSTEDAVAVAREIGYPCVLRPKQSGGGAGIRFLRSEAELRRSLGRVDPASVYLQQYIQGLDLSCSVLGTGTDSFALSLQGQLIGMPSSGRPCDFAYCGNYVPVGVSDDRAESIVESCRKLCSSLALKGSNGVDLVLDRSGDAWLMEVNPRLQGSLEMIEHASGASVTLLHYVSWLGDLPVRRPSLRPTVRMIVYANRTGAVGNLGGMSNLSDVTPNGVLVRRGDPICTIVMTARSLGQCYASAVASASRVQHAISEFGQDGAG